MKSVVAQVIIAKRIQDAVLKERERCAKIVSDSFNLDSVPRAIPASPDEMLRKIRNPAGSKKPSEKTKP